MQIIFYSEFKDAFRSIENFLSNEGKGREGKGLVRGFRGK